MPLLQAISRMKRTPSGTSVGVDDPYAHVERCDHLTDSGDCRLSLVRLAQSPWLSDEDIDDQRRCIVGPDGCWSQCPHFRSTATGSTCKRCGLAERRVAHRDDRRPLLEEHHLSYAEGSPDNEHEITVMLCRWCHAKVHTSWARIRDDVNPDPAAIAEQERRRGEELAEGGFHTAAERR